MSCRGKNKSQIDGVIFMCLAGVFFALMAVCVYGAKILAPDVPSSVTSFVRVVVNLLMLVIPAFFNRNIRALFGDFSKSLWLRGLFGGCALIAYFFSIQTIGVGESMFLQCMSGIYIVVLAPFILKERYSGWAMVGVLGSLFGLFLLYNPNLGSTHFFGQIVGLASGFLAAISALMVAKAGKSNPTETVVFYFVFVSLFLHIPYLALTGFAMPYNFLAWLPMIGAGIFAGSAQIYMTKAYQTAPASLITSVSYSSAIFGVFFSYIFFGEILSLQALLGCMIIFLCGVAVPFLRSDTQGFFARAGWPFAKKETTFL